MRDKWWAEVQFVCLFSFYRLIERARKNLKSRKKFSFYLQQIAKTSKIETPTTEATFIIIFTVLASFTTSFVTTATAAGLNFPEPYALVILILVKWI